METDPGLDETNAFAKMFSMMFNNPTPQPVPVHDWSPQKNTSGEFVTLESTNLTLQELMETHHADMLTPVVKEQKSCENPSPINSQVQTDSNHLHVMLKPFGSLDGTVNNSAQNDKFPPPVHTHTSQKRKHGSAHDDNTAYVKKPPNAFMIYRKEQSPYVTAKLGNADCAAVNTFIGQMWRALSKKEQEKYYEEAARQRELHNQRNPGWSARDNYGKKRKRSPRRPKGKQGSDSNPGSRGRPRFAPSWKNPQATSDSD